LTDAITRLDAMQATINEQAATIAALQAQVPATKPK
jgi:hypothetical protein